MTTVSRRSNSGNLSSLWFKGLKTKEEKDKLTELIRNSRHLIDHLLMIIQDELENVDKPTTANDFDNPSWSHKQAFKEGEKARLLFVKNLF